MTSRAVKRARSPKADQPDRAAILARNEHEFEMRLADAKQQVLQLERFVSWISRVVHSSTPSTGIELPIGATDDVRKTLSNIEATVAYVRGRQDAANGRGLIT